MKVILEFKGNDTEKFEELEGRDFEREAYEQDREWDKMRHGREQYACDIRV